MLKRFIEWIYTKIYIDTKLRNISINEGEVYWCILGENIGDEENGKGEEFHRSVLVFKKFNRNIFWGIPMSTKIKDGPYYIKVLLKNIEQSVMISQLRILDTKRLDKKIGYISKYDFYVVRKSVIFLIER
jgi:mRNA-degrading endonuclease toxin of MazEF toxin-antitoxin module